MKYELLDSGQGRKLEKFGDYVLDRPSLGALWMPENRELWKKSQAIFTREGQNNWTGLDRLPSSWVVEASGIHFKLMPTDFGHVGIFPEQRPFWSWIEERVRTAGRPVSVLNLFAYSGGSTLAAAKGGAQVCHLDASKGMVAWARENASLNGLEKAPIRWIIDDVSKFLARELKRDRRYDAIIMDPPSFGRGSQGEVFKIEENLPSILAACSALLSKQPLFVLLSCHTPGLTGVGLSHLLDQMMKGHSGTIDSGEMVLEGKAARSVPSGTFARWNA